MSNKDGFDDVGADQGSKNDKAVQVKAPILDDDGLAVLLEQGPDAARAVVTIGDGTEPAEPEAAADAEPKPKPKRAPRRKKAAPETDGDGTTAEPATEPDQPGA